VHRRLSDPAIDLTIAAPSGPSLAPFERAAELGLLVLISVTVLALALITYFTARLTRSLVRLVGAANAVAAGDLQHDVETHGQDEVGQLGRAFNTMLHSLRRTLEELAHREALAAVGEFAASLSHETRNGLTAVRLDLQRIEESAPPDSTEGTLAARALRNVYRLDSTVTGALAVARGGHAKLQPVELRTVLESAASAAESAFANSHSALSIDSGPASCVVRADATALEQLFLNLFLNAGQAMSHGGRATVELSVDETTCTVAIRDSGAGLAMEQVAQLGQPFYTSKRGGTGLGLSIARKIAAAHGGEVSIESQPGNGTVVRVRLPRD
jgi:signal transduction histidine kinase